MHVKLNSLLSFKAIVRIVCVTIRQDVYNCEQSDLDSDWFLLIYSRCNPSRKSTRFVKYTAKEPGL